MQAAEITFIVGIFLIFLPLADISPFYHYLEKQVIRLRFLVSPLPAVHVRPCAFFLSFLFGLAGLSLFVFDRKNFFIV